MIKSVLKICDTLLKRVESFLADSSTIVRSFRYPEVCKCLLKLKELLFKGRYTSFESSKVLILKLLELGPKAVLLVLQLIAEVSELLGQLC